MLDKKKLEYANDLFRMDNIEEILFLYLYNENYKNMKYVLTGDKYKTKLPDWMCDREYGDFWVLNLFSGNSLYFFDSKTVRKMMKGNAINALDICLGLDNQAVSYLKGIFTEQPKQIPQDKKKYIDFLLRKEVNFDYTLYVWENMKKITDKKVATNVIDTIKACERFKNIDVDTYKRTGVIRYIKNEDEIERDAMQMYWLIESGNKDKDIEVFWKKQQAAYLLLLEAIYIKFTSNRNAKHKFEVLFDFVNNELGVVLEREMVICYHFFNNDNKVTKFFKKVKDTNKSIIKDVKGMSWDLFHIRYMEFIMGMKLLEEVDYTIYSLLTFDRGMVECIEICPIKKFIIVENGFLPMFEYGVKDIVKENDLEKMYMQNLEKRHRIFEEADYDLMQLELEEKVEKCIKS